MWAAGKDADPRDQPAARARRYRVERTMRVLGFTTLVLSVALAAAPAFAVELPALAVPSVPVPPIRVPVPVPTVTVPPLPTPPLPAPRPAAPTVPAPNAPTPPTASLPTGTAPLAATSPSASATPSTRASRGSSSSHRAASASPARHFPRAYSHQARAQNRRRRSRTAAPARAPSLRPRSPAASTTAAAGRRAAAPHADAPRSPAARVADQAAGVVRALPAAVLWALVGTGAVALGLAGNAFWQSRQRVALERQRAALLDDIGLLSRALLPPVPPALDGLSVSAAYRPAEGPAAGGDFYDVFALDDDRLAILLGDVSGHGRASVTHAALARYTLRTLLAGGQEPGDALPRADPPLAPEPRPDFVPVIAAVYDRRPGELVYAKASHAPPI